MGAKDIPEFVLSIVAQVELFISILGNELLSSAGPHSINNSSTEMQLPLYSGCGALCLGML